MSDLISITCPSCGFSKSVPVSAIPPRQSTATCSHCNSSFPLDGHLKASATDCGQSTSATHPSDGARVVNEDAPPCCPGDGVPPPEEVLTVPLWVKVMVAAGLLLFLVQLPGFGSSLADAITKSRAAEADRTGRYGDAITCYQELHSRYPDDKNLTKDLAFCQYHAGQYIPALKTFELLVGAEMPKREVEKINATISDIEAKLK